MSAIMNSAILELGILNKKNFTHSLSLNLIMAAILTSTILDSAILNKKLHSFIWLILMMESILNSAMFDLPLPCWNQTPCYLVSDSLKETLTPFWAWLKLIQSDSNSFILSNLDDGWYLEFCHLEFGHLGFSHLSISSQIHSHLPRLVTTICT